MKKTKVKERMEKEEMVNNTEEKSLTVIKDKNIITKVISFFRNIFSKKEPKYQTAEESNYNDKTTPKQSFMALDDIEIKFQNFRQGNIKEEDLTEEEKQKMTIMFQERIEKEQTEINYLKHKIIELRAQYLKMN